MPDTSTRPATPSTPADRRGRRRFAASRQGKLFRIADATFAPAVTTNISLSGALLEVRTARPFRLGEPLGVVIGAPSNSGRAVITADALRTARVVRAVSAGPELQHVAVEFAAA